MIVEIILLQLFFCLNFSFSDSNQGIYEQLRRFTFYNTNASTIQCPTKSLIKIDRINLIEDYHLYSNALIKNKILAVCNDKTACNVEEVTVGQSSTDMKNIMTEITYHCRPGESNGLALCSDAYVELKCDFNYESLFFENVFLTNIDQKTAQYSTCHQVRQQKCQPIKLDITRLVVDTFCDNKAMCTLNFNSILHHAFKNKSNTLHDYECAKKSSLLLFHTCVDRIILKGRIEDKHRDYQAKYRKEMRRLLSRQQRIFSRQNTTNSLEDHGENVEEELIQDVINNNHSEPRILLILCLILLMLTFGIFFILFASWIIRRRYLPRKTNEKKKIIKDPILQDLNFMTSHNETFFNMPSNLVRNLDFNNINDEDIYQNQMVNFELAKKDTHPSYHAYLIGKNDRRPEMSYETIEEEINNKLDMVKALHQRPQMNLSEKSRRRKIPIVQYPIQENIQENTKRNINCTKLINHTYEANTLSKNSMLSHVSESDSDFLEPVLYDKR